MQINNIDRAQIIKDGIGIAINSNYGLFKLRLSLFDALSGSGLSASAIAELLLPRSGEVTESSLRGIALLTAKIEMYDDNDLSDLIGYAITIKAMLP